ncbi:MAG: RNA methyltransferase [Candidatus Woesearchaeota archaeon]
MISVILVKPETSGNIGFIARIMANFDLDNLIIVEPLCDFLDNDALKKSMHAKEILKKAKKINYEDYFKLRNDFDLIIGTTSVLGTDYNIKRIPLSSDFFSKKLRSYDTKKNNIAIVFGNEGIGLTNNELEICDFVITIETSKKYPSMNLSHAVAIILYEIYKKIGENKITSHLKLATRKEKEIIYDNLYKILDIIDFSTKEKKETQKKVWKNIFEKSMITKREAFAVIGFLRKLNKKLINNR